MEDANEELFVEFEDKIMDLVSDYQVRGLPMGEIISAIELRLQTLKDEYE